MKIEKLVINNYKIFKTITIPMNSTVNIFVGENDSGKTTILEALFMALTGKINGSNILTRLNPDWFNYDVRTQYRNGISEWTQVDLPLISIEVFLCDLLDKDIVFKNYEGANNSLRETAVGVKLEIKFNDEYSDTYKQLLKEGKISDIPVELYKVEFRSFANPDYYIGNTAKKIAYIDTTKKDYGTVLNRFVSNSISEYLSEEDETNLRIAYRGNRKAFTDSEAVKALNEKLRQDHEFGDKVLSLNLRENEIDSWKSEMALSLDNIPFENSGFGTQNMLKSELLFNQNIDVDFIILEEPENNLSFTNMSILISKLTSAPDKQLFISTHSSFVANKLGLNNLHLVANHNIEPFRDLSLETYNYFLKLPGYNTLRLLLANSVILVEGPADELIIQRAYWDNYKKLPIEAGIDVIAVGGIAFKRYCELAKLINKNIIVVIDNDGNIDSIKNRYSDFSTIATLCYEYDETLNTLEPSVLAANKDSFEDFKKIIYLGSDVKDKSYDEICDFMKKNKTEWAMRVFQSDKTINYPQYIKSAIGVSADE